MLILNVTKLVQIFISCDDFCQQLSAHLRQEGIEMPSRDQARRMIASERMAIVIFYHLSGMKCFKWYYLFIIRRHLSDYFPQAYSYERFVELMGELTPLLGLFLVAHCYEEPTEANYIDSQKIVVCHNLRIERNRVFNGQARRGKSSTGWFFGFKIYLIINRLGQIVLCRITTANVADNNLELLRGMARSLNRFICLFGDRGYLSSLKEELAKKGFHLIARKRKNMKEETQLTKQQKYYARHRGLIETVFDMLKYICDIEHSRHRSTQNFLVNLIAALIAYDFFDQKPTIGPYDPKGLMKNDLSILAI